MPGYSIPRPNLPPGWHHIADALFPDGIHCYPGRDAAHAAITANATRMSEIDGLFSAQTVKSPSQAYDDLMIEKVLLTQRNKFLAHKLGL